MNLIIRILVGGAVLMHGIGHILFLMPLLKLDALKIGDWGQTTRSWLLTGLLGDGITRFLGILLWLVVLIIYISGVVGFFTQSPWWPQAFIGASIISVIGLLLFWFTPPASPNISALVFDLAVLVAILGFHLNSLFAS